MPTYNRHALLERALQSLVATPPQAAAQVEIVVSDNSAGEHSATLVKRILNDWAGPWRYEQHERNVGMVGNFNRCVELASGRWVLILHDDDYLLPGGVVRLLAGIDRATPEDRALLFGARVVDSGGHLLRPQVFARERTLGPERALACLLSRSSFVRFPAIVVRRDAYAAVGSFDEGIGGFADVDMWRRVLGAWGVRLLPLATAAYVVHPEADTQGVFTAEAVHRMMTVFDRAARQGVLSERVVRTNQRHWFHQFILAGAVRCLRAGDRVGARAVLQLFGLPAVRGLGVSKRWLPVRVAVSTAVLTVRSPRLSES